jgi:putative FmdB family regulatory protein
MPWYDFQCESCGNVFEAQRAMSDTKKPKCKYCGSTRTVKIYSAAGIQFKGSGFYVTDSRGSTSSKATKSDSAVAGSASSGENPAASDAKAATAPAEKSTKTASADKDGKK